jgi:hypothetical protein
MPFLSGLQVFILNCGYLPDYCWILWIFALLLLAFVEITNSACCLVVAKCQTVN